MAARSYDDPCGVARALDRVGERWALLVVRELLLGPKRFSDLRAGLPHASPNVLSQRLDELERSGVVTRRPLPPPAGGWVYALTPWGQALEDAVLALGRWGSRATPLPRGELSRDALMLALMTTFDAAAAGTLRARVALQLGDERFLAVIARRRLDLARSAADAARDASLISDAATLRKLVFADLTLSHAVRAGRARVEGERRLVERFLRLFARPAPAG